jgi:hypothetical protein
VGESSGRGNAHATSAEGGMSSEMGSSIRCSVALGASALCAAAIAGYMPLRTGHALLLRSCSPRQGRRRPPLLSRPCSNAEMAQARARWSRATNSDAAANVATPRLRYLA